MRLHGNPWEGFPPNSTVKKWAAHFKSWRESVEDDGRSGCPKDATADLNVKVVHILVMCIMRREMRNIVSEVGVSFGAVQSILTDILRMSKFSVWWVPMISKGLDSIFLGYEDDTSDFIQWVVTQDETCVHNFDSESKMQSKQLKHHLRN